MLQSIVAADAVSLKHHAISIQKVYSIHIILNSLAPVRFAWNFKQVIFKQILVNYGWGISCEIVLIWMTLDFTDE